MKTIINHLTARLDERQVNRSLRSLSSENNLTDFCSNDYLGFARSPELNTRLLKELESHLPFLIGSTGSRLISGNDSFTENLEQDIAEFHGANAGLIFNSGYDANIGLFSSVARRGDTIITDELIHASIVDGARLSYANRYTFSHNDPGSLEQKLKAATGNVFVAIESIYSMDGDEAPLKEIIALTQKHHAALIVDEAHAIGVLGHQGRGLVHELKLQAQVFATLITFGKSLGTHGAIVLGSNTLRSYLINFARSFIYTTAASFITHLSVRLAYEFLLDKDHQQVIREKISLFDNLMNVPAYNGRSAIKSVIIGGNEQTKLISNLLNEKGFDVRAILSPTVAAGKERLRICLHTYNTDDEIRQLVSLLKHQL